MGEFSERTEATRSSHLIFASLSLAGAAATGGAVHRYGVHVTGVISALFCAALVLLTAMILRQRQIPNLFTTALIWSGLLANLPVIHALFAPIQGAIFGAVVGYLLPWSVAMLACWIGRDVTGPGDFKLCAAAGAWLGVGALPQVFAMSVIVAAISMTLRRVASRHSAEACRVFGPSIAIAAGITMCCGVWLNIPCVTVMGGVL
jgi:leader peptidase (prepilin peptidase)/N-methyltransferase